MYRILSQRHGLKKCDISKVKMVLCSIEYDFRDQPILHNNKYNISYSTITPPLLQHYSTSTQLLLRHYSAAMQRHSAVLSASLIGPLISRCDTGTLSGTEWWEQGHHLVPQQCPSRSKALWSLSSSCTASLQVEQVFTSRLTCTASRPRRNYLTFCSTGTTFYGKKGRLTYWYKHLFHK